MFRNKRYFIVFISCIMASILMNSYVSGKTIHKFNSRDNINNSLLLAAIPNEFIYLYSLDSDEGKGVYQEILLDVKGKQKIFNWIVDSGLSFRPQLILSDINNDSKKELIVITTKWTGTGINVQEVHIFNIDTLEEIKVQDPLDIISKNVKTKVNKTKDIIDIKININGKETNIGGENINMIYNESLFKKRWRDNLYFGNMINYEFTNGKLKASIGGQVSFIAYIGEVKVEYKFENNMLVANKIDFEVYDRFKK